MLTVRRADGSERVLKPWLVALVGGNTMPIMPDMSGLGSFAGAPMHSAQFEKRKKVLVFGTGNSGHDVAHDLCNSSAETAMVQCATTMRSLHL